MEERLLKGEVFIRSNSVWSNTFINISVESKITRLNRWKIGEIRLLKFEQQDLKNVLCVMLPKHLRKSDSLRAYFQSDRRKRQLP